MLAVSDLGAGYGPITALEQVSFAAPRGRITAVLGANGAGKTTLLRSISGLHPCRSGTVELDGRASSGCRPNGCRGSGSPTFRRDAA